MTIVERERESMYNIQLDAKNLEDLTGRLNEDVKIPTLS